MASSAGPATMSQSSSSTSNGQDCSNMDSSDRQENLADLIAPLCFTSRRHQEDARRKQLVAEQPPWRLRERMKTVSVALVMCLNVGVDPPDAPKSSPCARMECWTDPFSMNPMKALESIGATLQRQYERWQPRARYKQTLDPTVDDVKRLCTSLRRNAKDDRVLMHYNGHGVPRPTRNGEIWVFNKAYTQYIPLSLYDLQTWMGSPAIYVWESNAAAICIEEFNRFARIREDDRMKCSAMGMSMSAPSLVHNAIQLAACSCDEILPMDKDVPADLFTSCLTTPIKTSLRWWFYRTQNKRMVPDVTADMLDKVPGRLTDRRTPLGELNWIFTAIADSIAWDVLPTDTFQDLFRHDLLVASLFRNFLLAEVVMGSYGCKPVSSPVLPSAKHHPLWNTWEMVMDSCLSQLPGILGRDEPYENSTFFSEQLTAFAVWLRLRNINRAPPQQLPVILQVLLSPLHRYQALELLGRYLEQGPKAVHTALNVGIFPYVVKLLQSTALDLRPLLVFVWAKILAVDPTCQVDLVKDGAFKYFLNVLSEPNLPGHHARNQHDYQAMAAFILTCMVRNYPPGQEACLQSNLIASCLELLDTNYPQLKQWVIICLGCMWQNYDKARWCGVRDRAHEKLFPILADPSPEVRSAVVFALGTFLSGDTVDRTDQSKLIDQNVGNVLAPLILDGSNFVREELCLVFRTLVNNFESQFLAAMLDESQRMSQLVVQQQQMIIPGPSAAQSSPTVPSLLAGGSQSSSPAINAGSSTGSGGSGGHKRVARFGSTGATISLGTGLAASTQNASPDVSVTEAHRGGDWVLLNNADDDGLETSVPLTQLGKQSDALGTRADASLLSTSTVLGPSLAASPSVLGASLIQQLSQTPGHNQSLIVGLPASSGPPIGLGTSAGASFSNMWRALCLLATDPHLEVELMADRIIKRLKLNANQSRSYSMSLPSSPRTNRPRIMRVASNSPSNSSMATTSSGTTTTAATTTSSSSSIGGVVFTTGAPPGDSGPTNPTTDTIPPLRRGDLPRLKSLPSGGPAQRTPSAGDSPKTTTDALKSATIPRSQSVQHFGGMQSRIVEDYYDNMPGDIIETVDNFRTHFVDWLSSSYVLSAQEWESENDADGKQFLERHWRFKRNAEVRAEAKALLKDSVHTKYRLEDQVFVNRNPEVPHCLLFHAYQSELLAADKNNITVWDWELGMQINTITNHSAQNRHGARITTLDLINPHDQALLMVGTDDGCVRVWRDYNVEGGGSQVAAWRALTDVTPIPRSGTSQLLVPSLVLDWEQESGVLFASGNSSIIRVWDTQREQIIQDIPTGADTCVTSLTSDSAGRSSLIAGCGDGSIRLYDRRLPPRECSVRSLREHTSWVVKVYLQQGASQGKIISAGVGGDIRYWDPRFQESTATIKTGMRVSCMDVHRNAPLMAVGSRDHVAKIYHIDSQESLGVIKYHEGFMGQRIASVSALAFHPYKVCMAAGFGDSLLSIYADEKKKL